MDDVCDICGGTGQIGIFRGLSRFIMTYEECPECFGTGLNRKDGDDEDPTAMDNASDMQSDDSSNDGSANENLP